MLRSEIFDPSYRKNDIDNVRIKVLDNINNRESLNRGYLVKEINSAFKKIKFSHLAVLDPKTSKMVIKMSGGNTKERPQKAVLAYLVGI